MKIETFENELQTLRAANGWKLVIEMPGIFIVQVYDKESGKFLAETGCTSMLGILVVLGLGLDNEVWAKEKVIEPNEKIQAEIDRISPLVSTSNNYHGPYRNGLQFALDVLNKYGGLK